LDPDVDGAGQPDNLCHGVSGYPAPEAAEPGSYNWAGARALRADEDEEGGLSVAGALRTNEEEEGLYSVEEVGEGDATADEGEGGVEGWGEEEMGEEMPTYKRGPHIRWSTSSSASSSARYVYKTTRQNQEGGSVNGFAKLRGLNI
jgi:hypothetical protein